METFDAWKLPHGERHLQKWMRQVNKRVDGRLTYQYHKYHAAMQHVKSKRTAIDVGAHVGLWSYFMARDFQHLISFEPMPEHQDCWMENMKAIQNAELYPVALGEKKDVVRIMCRTPGSSGDTGVDPDAERSSLRATIHNDGNGVEVELHRLDEYQLNDIDFIKLDCEGYEIFALRGAEETLKRCKPCVIVEQKPETGMAQRYKINVLDGVNYLKSLGAVQRGAIQGDYILSWN